MFNWLWRWLGWGGQQPAREDARPQQQPASRLDAARTGPENREHWRYADALSPNASANHQDRKIVRERARYEASNNCFASSAVNARAEDVIGSGPRLQLIDLPEPAATQVETLWQYWCDCSCLADTLRLMYRAMIVDGESFALVVDNPKLDHPVTLCLRPFEADRVTDPAAMLPSDRLADGITFDSAGNPVSYTVLRQHPGDQLTVQLMEWDVHPAQNVFHLFRPDRPGQARGTSWLAPALHLFAQLRRWTMAVLTAAETAANISGILKSDLPPGTEQVAIESMDEIAIPRGALLTMPGGYDVSQLKAEQPQQQFGDFRTQILIEIGRVLDMPLNRITGNSSGYNYSSGRLDHLGYHRGIWLDRDKLLRLVVLDRLFRMWLDELALTDAMPAGLPPFKEWQWEWQWDAFGDIDPLKEAQAAQQLLANNLTDLAEQCAARGRRWDQVLRQKAREQALMDELGLTPAQAPSASPGAFQKPQQAPPQDDYAPQDEEVQSNA